MRPKLCLADAAAWSSSIAKPSHWAPVQLDRRPHDHLVIIDDLILGFWLDVLVEPEHVGRVILALERH